MPGFGPLEVLLKDATVSDILINGPKNVYVERRGKIEKTNVKARHTREATNSAASRCGQVWTLSTGEALTSWIDPLLTTVSRRWV